MTQICTQFKLAYLLHCISDGMSCIQFMDVPDFDRALAYIHTLGRECSSPYVVVDVFIKLCKWYKNVKILSLNMSTVRFEIDSCVVRVWNSGEYTYCCGLDARDRGGFIQFRPVRYIHNTPRSIQACGQTTTKHKTNVFADDSATQLDGSEECEYNDENRGADALGPRDDECVPSTDVLLPIYSNWKLHWPIIVNSSARETWKKYKSMHFPLADGGSNNGYDTTVGCDTIAYLSDDMFVNAILIAMSSSKW